jgi:N-acetylglutamate synthase
MSIIFSQFTIDLYEEVIFLWKQCDGIGLSDADSRGSIQAYLERNPGMSFVASENSNIIGAILCGHDGRRGYIHHLAVSAEYRRQGLGHGLVEKSLSVLQAVGIQKCHLFIFNNNTSGIKFWENIGWTYRKDINVISKTIEQADKL